MACKCIISSVLSIEARVGDIEDYIVDGCEYFRVVDAIVVCELFECDGGEWLVSRVRVASEDDRLRGRRDEVEDEEDEEDGDFEEDDESERGHAYVCLKDTIIIKLEQESS